jgi:hypothetical protein
MRCEEILEGRLADRQAEARSLHVSARCEPS